MPEVLDILAPALREKNIEEFKLDCNGFINTNDGIDFAIQVMRHNASSLRKFTWKRNPIYKVEQVKKLVAALHSLPSLHYIYLENCNGARLRGYAILCSLLCECTNLRGISFCSNNVHSRGETHLPDFIATNPPLQSLYLNNNHFNDSDIVLISDALQRNTNLKTLELRQNLISDVGVNALANALGQNSTLRFLDLSKNNGITVVGCNALKNAVFNERDLNSVADSNHACKVTGIDSLFGNMGSLSKSANRKNKIYFLLSLRNKTWSNVYDMDNELENTEDESLKLVPYVLEIPARVRMSHSLESAAKPPLSVMYEFVRNWKMPQLFDLKDPKKSHWQATKRAPGRLF